MAKQCLYGCVRIFLMTLNIIFLITGLALLGLSLWMHFDRAMLMRVNLLQLPTAPGYPFDKLTYTLMGIGGGIALVSFLGCCGSWTESSCFLCLYSTLLVLLVLGQVVCGILMAIFHQKTEVAMKNQIRFDYNITALPDFNQTNPVTTAWDKFQIQMKCCGAAGPKDYQLSSWYNATRQRCNHACPEIPQSCCTDQTDNRLCQAYYSQSLTNPHFVSDSSTFHSEGCYSVMMASLSSVKWYLIGSSIGVVILQMLNILLTCVLMSKIRAEEAKYPTLYYTDDDEMLSLRDVYTTQRSTER